MQGLALIRAPARNRHEFGLTLTSAGLTLCETDQTQLVINMKTEHTIGLDVPAALLARADELIE